MDEARCSNTHTHRNTHRNRNNEEEEEEGVKSVRWTEMEQSRRGVVKEVDRSKDNGLG